MQKQITRRQGLALTLAVMAGLASPVAANSKVRPAVKVWKDPNCGCCNDWLEHLKANGFDVAEVHHVDSVARARLGMPAAYASCHTALIDGYLIEGHVPASDIKRLLAERPQALGLSAPGMPVGSPGMDGPVYQGRRDPYEVVLVQRGGGHTVFARHNMG